MTTSSEKHFDSDLIKNKISNCILEFLNLLSNDRKKNLGLSLFTKFCEINYENEIESGKILYEKYKILKLKPYFIKWNNITFQINKIDNHKVKNIENSNLKTNKNSNSNNLIKKKVKKKYKRKKSNFIIKRTRRFKRMYI